MELTGIGGKVALVTGAAGDGIGQAIARRFAEIGAVTVVTDAHARRTAAVTESIAAGARATVVGHVMDVADRDRVDEVLARVTDEVGPVDILVNNAAINVQGQIWDYDPVDWDRGIAVNLSACWYLCRRTMPAMRERGGGAIVNISSVAPDIGGAGVEAPYAVSKGGLHALTRAVAVEGGPHAIRANTVTMGVVSGTRFIDAHPETADRYVHETPLGRNAVPEDIVSAVMFLCSDQASFITGEILNVSGGWHMRT